MLHLLFGLVVGAASLFAQFDVAQITGLVRDSSQNLVPNAPVVAIHKSTGREFRTNSRGRATLAWCSRRAGSGTCNWG